MSPISGRDEENDPGQLRIAISCSFVFGQSLPFRLVEGCWAAHPPALMDDDALLAAELQRMEYADVCNFGPDDPKPSPAPVDLSHLNILPGTAHRGTTTTCQCTTIPGNQYNYKSTFRLLSVALR